MFVQFQLILTNNMSLYVNDILLCWIFKLHFPRDWRYL